MAVKWMTRGKELLANLLHGEERRMGTYRSEVL